MRSDSKPPAATPPSAGKPPGVRPRDDDDRSSASFTRVDAPHPRPGEGVRLLELADPEEPGPAEQELLTAAAAGEHSALAAAQIGQQASELAAWLRQRQRELDRREVQQSALAARLDGERRATRLWLAERQQEIAEQERELSERRLAVEQQAAQMAAAQSALEADHRDLDSRLELQQQVEASLAQAESHLRQRLAAHEEEVAAWRTRMRDAAAEERCRQSKRREQEAILESMLSAVARQHELLEQEQLSRQQALQKQQDEAALVQRRIAAELVARGESLDRREQVLAVREKTLAQLQSQLEESHRAMLRSRIAVDEVWSRLLGEECPAEVVRELARVRGELALQEQHAEDEQGQRRKLLEQLAQRLKNECRQLQDQRRRWQAFREKRQQEIEQLADSLAAREKEIARQSQSFRLQELQWLAEKQDLLSQLRRSNEGEVATAQSETSAG